LLRRAAGGPDHCGGAGDAQAAQSLVAGPADAAQSLLAVCRVFLGSQSRRGDEVAAGLELRGIALDGQRQRGDRTDARDGGQALADRIGSLRGV